MITEIKNAIWVSLNFSISLPDHIVSIVLKNYNIFLTLDGFDFSLIQIQTIYKHGGQNFWVHNTGPLGCLPQKLATATKNASDFISMVVFSLLIMQQQSLTNNCALYVKRRGLK